MVEQAPTERRQHPRRTLHISARLLHELSERTFPCRCADASAGGAKLLVPARVPVAVGHAVRILPCESTSDRISDDLHVQATVVRVDRQSLLAEGHLTVGVRFETA